MTGPRMVVVGAEPVVGGAVGSGAVGTVPGTVEMAGTLVGTTEPVVGELGPADATTDVVEVPRLVGGTDVSPSSPEEHPARIIARATAGAAPHRLTLT